MYWRWRWFTPLIIRRRCRIIISSRWFIVCFIIVTIIDGSWFCSWFVSVFNKLLCVNILWKFQILFRLGFLYLYKWTMVWCCWCGLLVIIIIVMKLWRRNYGRRRIKDIHHLVIRRKLLRLWLRIVILLL